MRNKKKLGEERVYIDNDLTWSEREVRKKVIEKMKELRKHGKK